jgi:hypothetical protein
MLWGALVTALTFLAAGNSITNPFSYMLHNDALSLVICAIAFLALVRYASTSHPGWLVVLAFVPAAGFMVKQSLAFWGPLVVGYLVLFDRPRHWSRALIYAVAALTLLAGVYLGGRALWGFNFHHWVVTGSRQSSGVRAPGRCSTGSTLDVLCHRFCCGGVVFPIAARCASARSLVRVVCVAFDRDLHQRHCVDAESHGPGSLLAAPWLGVLLCSCLAGWERPRRGGSRRAGCSPPPFASPACSCFRALVRCGSRFHSFRRTSIAMWRRLKARRAVRICRACSSTTARGCTCRRVS